MFLSQKPVSGKLFASSVVYGLIPSKITQSLYHSYNKILLSPGTILFVFTIYPAFSCAVSSSPSPLMAARRLSVQRAHGADPHVSDHCCRRCVAPAAVGSDPAPALSRTSGISPWTGERDRWQSFPA